MGVSAHTGDGIDDLMEHLAEHTDRITRSGSHDEGISVNERHAEALAGVIECLKEAGRMLSGGESLELVASGLRGAVDGVSRIVGRIDNEEMLDRLFKQFCIGK